MRTGISRQLAYLRLLRPAIATLPEEARPLVAALADNLTLALEALNRVDDLPSRQVILPGGSVRSAVDHSRISSEVGRVAQLLRLLPVAHIEKVSGDPPAGA